jgi:hypothetical protein
MVWQKPIFMLQKKLKLRKKGMRREEHIARIAEVHTDVQYLNQRTAQSVVSNNLSFMVSLLHVSASRRS